MARSSYVLILLATLLIFLLYLSNDSPRKAVSVEMLSLDYVLDVPVDDSTCSLCAGSAVASSCNPYSGYCDAEVAFACARPINASIMVSFGGLDYVGCALVFDSDVDGSEALVASYSSYDEGMIKEIGSVTRLDVMRSHDVTVCCVGPMDEEGGYVSACANREIGPIC